MKTAVLSDIHGNPWALESILKRIDHVDRVMILGDLVGIGPRPAEVLDMLIRDPRIEKVIGNHDHNTLFGTELGPTDIVPRKPHHEWVRSKLKERHLRYLPGPMDLRSKDVVDMRFMHRHPSDCGSPVPYFEDPTPDVLDDFYSDVDGEVLFFGHTHFPLDVIGRYGRRYINPGAVGAQNQGMASYVLIDTDNGSVSIGRKEAHYDVQSVVEEIEREEVPYHKFIVSYFF